MTYLLDDNELILNISVCYAGFVDVVSDIYSISLLYY